MLTFQTQLNQMDQGLKGHGKLLTTLTTTQAQQCALLTSLNEKVDGIVNAILLGGVISPTRSESQQMAEPISTSNPSHGVPEGRAS